VREGTRIRKWLINLEREGRRRRVPVPRRKEPKSKN